MGSQDRLLAESDYDRYKREHKAKQIENKNIIHKIMERYNIHKKDIPGALLIYKVMNWGLFFGAFALCYRYSPVKYIFSKGEPRKLIDSIRNNYSWYKKGESYLINKSKKLGENKYVSNICSKLGYRSKKVPLALAESTLLYKVFVPIHIPLQFMIIIQIYNFKNYKKDSHKVTELN